MKILCVGAGGIGSYFAQHIDQLIDLKQIKDTKFYFCDDDIVERKNILYQNFESSDIDSKKTDALKYRYLNLTFISKRIVKKDLTDYNLVILCADNNIIRRFAWENYIENSIPFIDSRANGKAIGIFSSDTENYLDTLDNSTESSSCQNPFQIEKEEIEFGNVIVAAVLAQVTLDFYRTKLLPNDLMIRF